MASSINPRVWPLAINLLLLATIVLQMVTINDSQRTVKKSLETVKRQFDIIKKLEETIEKQSEVIKFQGKTIENQRAAVKDSEEQLVRSSDVFKNLTITLNKCTKFIDASRRGPVSPMKSYILPAPTPSSPHSNTLGRFPLVYDKAKISCVDHNWCNTCTNSNGNSRSCTLIFCPSAPGCVE